MYMNLKGIIIIAISVLLFNCNTSSKKSQEDIVRGFYAELNKADFKQISKFITDSIKTSEGGEVLTKTKEDFYKFFQWDSVFAPIYKIIDLKKIDNKIEITVSKSCKRIRFLHDKATVSKIVTTFKENKIHTINTVDYLVFDFQKWQSRRDTLLKRMEINHSDFPSFIHDQTLHGAYNYSKAIDLFLSEN